MSIDVIDTTKHRNRSGEFILWTTDQDENGLIIVFSRESVNLIWSRLQLNSNSKVL